MDPLTQPPPTTASYVPSTDAAARYGLTNDHIASLCRRAKVEGKLEAGRLWMVNEESLQAYLARAQAERDARHRELSEQFKQEYQRAAASRIEAPRLIAAPRSIALPRLSAHFAALLALAAVLGAAAMPLQETIAQIPWQQLPEALTETSLVAYDRTFVAAAEQLYVGIDIAVELQVGAYKTVGAAAAAFAAAAPAPQLPASVAAWPAPAHVEDQLTPLLSGAGERFADAPQGGVLLPILPSAPPIVVDSHALLTLRYIPQAVAELFAEATDVMSASIAVWYLDTAERVSLRLPPPAPAEPPVSAPEEPPAPAPELRTEKLCVEDVCVTRDEFLAMLEAAQR